MVDGAQISIAATDPASPEAHEFGKNGKTSLSIFINNTLAGIIVVADLIKPTTPGGGKRELPGVNWTLPAYANRHIIIRNDEEIIRVSLEKPSP